MERNWRARDSSDSTIFHNWNNRSRRGAVTTKTENNENQNWRQREAEVTETRPQTNWREKSTSENSDGTQSVKQPERQSYTEHLQKYLEPDTPPDVLLTALMKDHTFWAILKARQQPFETICVVLAILAKVCKCPTDNQRVLLNRFFIQILPQSINDHHFLTVEILLFVAQMDHYVIASSDRRDACITATHNLLVFLQTLQGTLPTASLDVVKIILPLLMMKIDVINKKEECFKRADVDVLNEIDAGFKNMLPTSVSKQSDEPVERPPNDFRSIEICPTPEDIFSTECPFLRPNIVNGRYAGGVDHYLDVQFRLLREDFIRPLREGIQDYRKMLHGIKKGLIHKVRDIHIYRNIVIGQCLLANGDIIFNIAFDNSNLRNIQWASSKRLLTGSVVCLSLDDFESFAVATVAGRRDPSKLARGFLQLKFVDTSKAKLYRQSASLVMVESLSFFEAYRHNLQVMQSFHENNFPLQKYIVDVENVVGPPPYLTPGTVYDLSELTCPLIRLPDVPMDENSEFSIQKYFKELPKPRPAAAKANQTRSINIQDDSQWPDEKVFGLDESQYAALKAALTKQLVIIQGPPGTGKTYVGLRIMQAILRNTKTKGFPPVLVVCYTNHALDQFLEGMLPFCQKMIRVGGNSKSEILNELNINRQSRFYFRQYKEYKEQEEMYQKIALKLEHQIKKLRAPKRIFDHELLTAVQRFSQEQFMCMHTTKTHPISYWLGYTPTKHIVNADAEANINNQAVYSMTATYLTPDELDGDEDEINFIQNMRMADLDDDYDDHCHGFQETRDEYVDYMPLENEGFRYQKHEIERHKRQFHAELRRSDKMTMEEARSVDNIWTLETKDRWRLYRFWVALEIESLEEEVVTLSERYSEHCSLYQTLRMKAQVSVAARSQIVGMTTTGAAKYRHIIDGIKPKVVIVEEAAEVLEAHIITSLCEQTEHLILIGDHQQLKPNPTVFELAKKFNLETSLYERLINNGVQHHQLKLQHRMRPEISSLLVPHFYRELRDHPSVYEYEHIKGVSCDMFFLNHNQQEAAVADTQSRLNDFEAEFVVRLCKYLVQQGYDSSQITILTMYSGQIFRVKSLMKKHDMLRNIRATVVDNFQGEESDIIIISFVRSNDDGDIGFLKTSNRVNVALSRAKMGLFCIGNFDCLAKKCDLWRKLVEDLKRQKAIGDHLKLYCQTHPTTGIEVNEANDFDDSPEGGCLLPCKASLACGHVCPKSCHAFDPEHKEVKCIHVCDKVACAEGHRCRKICHFEKECGDCPTMVMKILPCKHEMKVKCSTPPEEATCTAPCEKSYSLCSHKCNQKCGEKCNPEECNELVSIVGVCGHEIMVECSLSNEENKIPHFCKERCGVTLDCGHICNGTCSTCNQGRLHIPCMDKCSRILVCGHECKEICSLNCPPCRMLCRNSCSHSKCELKCGEPCVPCKEDCTWECEHLRCSKLCGELCDRDICLEPCKKVLNCGHDCIGLCGEKCPKLCRVCDAVAVTEIVFDNEKAPNARFIEMLECGDVIEVESLLKWLQEDDEIVCQIPQPQAIRKIQMKTCPKCKTPTRKTKSLKYIVKQELHDIELVKQRTVGNANENIEKQKCLNIEAVKMIQNLNSCLPFVNKIKHILSQLEFETNFDRGFRPSLHYLRRIANILVSLIRIEDIFSSLKCDWSTSNLTLKLPHLDQTVVSPWINKFKNRLYVCLCFLERFQNSTQQIKDVTIEIDLLELVAITIRCLQSDEKHIKAQPILFSIFELAFKPGPCHANIFNEIMENLKEVSKVVSGIELPADEIHLKAINFSSESWFKCANGHVYCVDDCDGGLAQCKCPKC